MKSRLAMYSKLQILAKLIANTHSNSNANNPRNINHMDGVIDMIHLSLRNIVSCRIHQIVSVVRY